MTKYRRSSYSMTVDRVLLQPWFLPNRVMYAIYALIPPDYWKKMRYFFDDYGCIICGKEHDYHANGMCRSCFNRTRKKIAQSVKRRLQAEPKRRLDLILLSQHKLAKKLLGRFSDGTPSRRRPTDIPRQHNPVDEALSNRPE